MFTNGGAAVAILAFVGNAWAKGIVSDTLTSIAAALASFSFGVLSAAFAAGVAYLVQRSFLEGFGRDSRCDVTP